MVESVKTFDQFIVIKKSYNYFSKNVNFRTDSLASCWGVLQACTTSICNSVGLFGAFILSPNNALNCSFKLFSRNCGVSSKLYNASVLWYPY